MEHDVKRAARGAQTINSWHPCARTAPCAGLLFQNQPGEVVARLPRVFAATSPNNLTCAIRQGLWPPAPLFTLLFQRRGVSSWTPFKFEELRLYRKSDEAIHAFVPSCQQCLCSFMSANSRNHTHTPSHNYRSIKQSMPSTSIHLYRAGERDLSNVHTLISFMYLRTLASRCGAPTHLDSIIVAKRCLGACTAG
eukprot:525440-Amphidinium_carterae.1